MIFRSFILIAVLVLMGSCDNEFEITAEWEDIPIVYGLLSPTDTAHYIRVEKAFLDPDQSALELARIPDSLYYNNLDIALINLTSGIRYQLLEVDGTLEGYPREDGIFASQPNTLYKLSANEVQLVPGTAFELSINRAENLPLVTAETEIIGVPEIKRPLQGQLLRFVYENLFKFVWIEVEGSGFYDVKLIFHYLESLPGEPFNFIPKSLEWKIAQSLTTNEAQVLGQEFYEYIAASIDPGLPVTRKFVNIDIIVQAGGPELREFLRVVQANTGITSIGGDIPQYTNLSEGLGLFSASNRDLKEGFLLHLESLDSLVNGSITGHLNFQ